MISIAGLEKGAVLAVLFNSATSRSLGSLNAHPKPMTSVIGAKVFEEVGPHFDYLQGRVLKVDLSGDEFDEALYDRDNGAGTASAAIIALRAANEGLAPAVEGPIIRPKSRPRIVRDDG